LPGCIFATKTCIDNGKNLLNTCPHNMANFGPLTAEIGLAVWGTPANFNRFIVFPSLLRGRRSPGANQTLHDVWPSPGLVPYVYIFEGFCRLTLRPSLAFSYIGSVTARYSSSRCQPNFAAWYKEWNYGTFAEGATYIRLAAMTLGIGPHSS